MSKEKFAVGDVIRRDKIWRAAVGDLGGQIGHINIKAGHERADRLFILLSPGFVNSGVIACDKVFVIRNRLPEFFIGKHISYGSRVTYESSWEWLGNESLSRASGVTPMSSPKVSSDMDDDKKRLMDFFRGKSEPTGPSGLLFP